MVYSSFGLKKTFALQHNIDYGYNNKTYYKNGGKIMKKCVQLIVFVYGHSGTVLEKSVVSIRLKGEKSGDAKKIPFDKKSGGYRAADLKPGQYMVSAGATDFETDEREIRLSNADVRQVFVLGKKGMPFLFRGAVKVPFEEQFNLLGVALKPESREKTISKFEKFAASLKLEREPAGPRIQKSNVRIFRLPEGCKREERKRILDRVAAYREVEYSGPVIRIDKETVSFLTNTIIVKFKSSFVRDDVPAFAGEYGFRIVRHIPYAGNSFELRYDKSADSDILELCRKMTESGKVEYAEPDLYSIAVDDQIHPGDFLYPEQWHHDLINTPEAWQLLSTLNPQEQFGSPDIIIAVVDSGVDMNNRDFTGNVSNGSPKVYEAFDFANMVANNNNLASNHGTGSAGAAAGMADNPSPQAGSDEGIAGVAGNCRLMAIRRSGPESRYSDSYIWMAGFDPQSTTPGFPAAISPGADVITNSFGYSTGMPISGLMSDTFDYLTSYGRNGKGVLLFFSVGNFVNPVDYTLQRPWAAYEKTFAVAASTLDNDGTTEVISEYSGFGGAGLIDFCMPSHDRYVGDRPLHNPPDNFGAVSCDAAGEGNLPAYPLTETTLSQPVTPVAFTSLTADVAAGSANLNVGSSAGFAVNQWLRIGQHGDEDAEWVRVSAIPGVNQLTVTACGNSHSDESPVWGTQTLTVASNAGFAANQWLLIGQPGQADTETCLVREIPAGNTQITVAGPLHNHAQNTAVITGPNDYRNSFGGTSFSAPIAAGVGALVLSANPDLSWVRVRDILRSTAEHIDSANGDPVGQYVDNDGDGVAEYSRWYGFGRLDAESAVQAAINLIGVGTAADIDTWIKENTADIGDVPCPPPYSPDVWVRNLDPAVDNPAQVNIHQEPVRGQDNWIYINVRNRGGIDSHDVYVRVFITRWAGTQYIYPDDFIPTNAPGTVPTVPLEPGVYLVGEIHIDSIPAGGVVTSTIVWPEDLIPPATVTVNGVDYSWADACLLVDVTPHDGPTPTGQHTWENNNLCQKNVFPIDPAGGDDMAIAFVVGHRRNLARYVNLRIVRNKLPKDIRLFIDYVDPDTGKLVLPVIQKKPVKAVLKTFAGLIPPGQDPKELLRKYEISPFREKITTVFTLPTRRTVVVPVPRYKDRYQIMALRVKGLKQLKKGEYQIDIYQETLDGKLEGGINLVFKHKLVK